jgi:hypothetical protein
MKKPILFSLLVLFSIWSYGQSVTITPLSNTVNACGQISFTINFTSVPANETVTFKVKPSEFVTFIGVAGVVNSSITTDSDGYHTWIWENPNNQTSVNFTYTNQLNCNSILNTSGGQFKTTKDQIIVLTDSYNVSNAINEVNYNINLPKIQIESGFGFTQIEGDNEEEIYRDVRLKNFNTTSFNGAIKFTEQVPVGITLVSVEIFVDNNSIIPNNVVTNSTTNTTTTTVENISVQVGQTIRYKPTYKINDCSNKVLYDDNKLYVELGCSPDLFCINPNNYTYQQSSAIKKVKKTARIELVSFNNLDLAPSSCNKIEKRWSATTIFKNNSSITATDLLININKSNFASNVSVYNFGIIDPSKVSFVIKNENGDVTFNFNPTNYIINGVGQMVVNTVSTNLCGGQQAASVPYGGTNIIYTNEGTYLKLNNLEPYHSITITYEVYRCCHENIGPFNYSWNGNNSSSDNFSTTNFTSGSDRIFIWYKAHSCDAVYSSSAIANINTSGGNTIKTDQLNECNTTDVQDNSVFPVVVENIDYNNSVFPNINEMDIWVRIESQKGLRVNGVTETNQTPFASNTISMKYQNYVWVPSEVTGGFTNNTGDDDIYYDTWAKFSVTNLPTGMAPTTLLNLLLGRGTINIDMKSYCDARASNSLYRVTVYVSEIEASCANFCKLPIARTECKVNVHCPGCNLPGTAMDYYRVERITFGLIDANNNRLPDDGTTLASAFDDGIVLNRVAYGDEFITTAGIRVDDNNAGLSVLENSTTPIALNRMYLISKIPLGEVVDILEYEISYRHNNNGVIQTQTLNITPTMLANNPNFILTQLVSNTLNISSLKDLEISIDLSIPTLQALGMTSMNGLTRFHGSDHIEVKTKMVVKRHFQTKYISEGIVNQAYLTAVARDPNLRFSMPTDAANNLGGLTPNMAYWCEHHGGKISMVDISISSSNFPSQDGLANNLNNCSQRILRYRSSVSMPTDRTDYFPYEYRNFNKLNSVFYIIPDGYEIAGGAYVVINTSGAAATLTQTHCFSGETRWDNIPVVFDSRSTDGDVYKVTVHDLYNYTDNCGASRLQQLILLDERQDIEIGASIRPMCPNNLTENVVYHNTVKAYNTNYPFNEYYEVIQPGTSNWIQKFKPELEVSSDLKYYASTRTFVWDNNLLVSNTSPFTNPNSTNGDFFLNAPNVFVAFNSPTGNFICTSINGISPQSPAVNGQIFQLGNITETENFKQFTIEGYYDCSSEDFDPSSFNNDENIELIYGWSCEGYPANLEELNDPTKCIWHSSETAIIHPYDAEMEVTFNIDNQDLENCDNTDFSIELESTSQGRVYDVSGTIILEIPQTMKPCSTNVTVTTPSGAISYIVPVDLGIENNMHLYSYDISDITSEGINNNQVVTIDGCLQTTCEYSEVANIKLKIQGEAYCGKALVQEQTKIINIAPFVPAEPDLLDFNCNQLSVSQGSSGSLSIEIVNSGNSTSANNNVLQVTLPQGVTISNTDFTNMGNNSWQLPFTDGISTGTTTITIPLVIDNTVECNTYNYQVEMIQTHEVQCNDNTCQRTYIASSCSSTITVLCETITITPITESICEGTTVTLEATTESSVPINWYVNGNSAIAFTGNPFFYTANIPGQITIQATIGTTTISDVITLTVTRACECPTQYHAVWGSNVGIDIIQANDQLIVTQANSLTPIKILIDGSVTFNGNLGDFILKRWDFYFTNTDEVGSIYLDNMLFNCQGCSFQPACENEMWDGITIGYNSGIVLSEISSGKFTKPSVIEGMKKGIVNDYPESAENWQYRRFYVQNTLFKDCETGIKLVKYKRVFNQTTDVIRNNRFTHNSAKQYYYQGNLIEPMPKCIELVAGDYYLLKIRGNSIDNAYYGIKTSSVYAHIIQNTITNTKTAIESIGTYSSDVNFVVRNWDITISNNTIILPVENHQFTFTETQTVNERIGIFTNTNGSYITNNRVSANANGRSYQESKIYYKGIDATGNKRYRIEKCTLQVRDDAMRIRNMGIMAGGGLITANDFIDNYYNLRFTDNRNFFANPVVAVRCNKFNINNIDPSGTTPKFCIALDNDATLDKLGGCGNANVGFQNRPCGNRFNIGNGLPNNRWYHIKNDNEVEFTYNYEANEFGNIVCNKLEGGNSIVTPFQCSTLSGCNNSSVPVNDPVQARQNMLADEGIGIIGQELALEKQKLLMPDLDQRLKNEAALKVAAYYLHRRDLQELENFTNTLPDTRQKAQLSSILYYEYLDTLNINKAQLQRQYINNTFTDNETNKWTLYAEVAERMAHFTDPEYIPTAQDTTQLQQVIDYSNQLSESACRILGNSGLCQNNGANFRISNTITNNYPRHYNTGIDTLNLVPNFSFELLDTNNCPYIDSVYNSVSETYSYIDTGTVHFAGWYYKKISPDLFNECNEGDANRFKRGLGMPNNFRGFQYPATGKGYMGGLLNASGDFFEFSGTQLTEALDTSKTYFVGFKVVASNFNGWVNNKQGVLFTMNPLNELKSERTTNPIMVQNRMHVYSDSIIRDTLNWVIILKKFKPDSAYQYITVGNLFSMGNTLEEATNYPNPKCNYCYYFDEIVVTEDSLYAYEVLTGTKPTNYDIRNTKDKINLYPNPTNGTVFINMPSTNKVYIYNMMGILTKELYLNQGEHEINISDFPSGVYLFRVGNESIKLVKE